MKLNLSKDADAHLYKALIDEEDQTPLKTPRNKSSKAALRSRRGGGVPCWCKCILITLALLFVMGVVATMVVYSAVSDVVQHLTVTTPHEKFPVVEMTEKELQAVKDRIALFVDELIAKNPAAADSLVVTQDEINGFIGHSDYLRGNMFVLLKPGKIEEGYSLPTEMLPGGKGRYFVATDYLKVEDDHIEVEMETAAKHQDWFDGPLLFAQLQYLVNHDKEDMLELYLTRGSFFGQEAPQDFIDKHKNLLEDLYNDPDSEDARAVIEGIERVSIEKGKITFQAKKMHTAEEEEHVVHHLRLNNAHEAKQP